MTRWTADLQSPSSPTRSTFEFPNDFECVSPFSFVISTTVLVIGYADESILPASLVRFVRDTGPQREFIRAGSRWWTAFLFVALSIAASLRRAHAEPAEGGGRPGGPGDRTTGAMPLSARCSRRHVRPCLRDGRATP